VSKYCGKMPKGSLVNALQLNKVDGRHWGYLHGELIPRFEEEWIESPTDEQVSYMLRLAQCMFRNNDIRRDESFTLMGEYVPAARQILREMGLTRHR
jgi:hypothetical protein